MVKITTKNTFHSSVLIVYIRGFGRAPLVANSHTQKGQERLHPIEGKKKNKQKLITNTSLVNNKTYVRLKEQTQENVVTLNLVLFVSVMRCGRFGCH